MNKRLWMVCAGCLTLAAALVLTALMGAAPGFRAVFADTAARDAIIYNTEAVPVFYPAPAFEEPNAPGVTTGRLTERAAGLRIAAYYPVTESDGVNALITERVAKHVTAFKTGLRHGSLDIRYRVYWYQSALLSVVFDIYQYNELSGLKRSVEAARFDVNGGFSLAEADVLADGWQDILRDVPAAAYGVFALDDARLRFYAPDGKETLVPVSRLGDHFAADMYLGWYSAAIVAETPASPPPASALSVKYVALTFDDGPHKTYTNRILDALAEYDAKATFFQLGSRMAGAAETVSRALDEGHEVGNHSYNHKQLTQLSAAQVAAQLDDTDAAFFNITGEHLTLLRPPYGATGKTVESLAKARGLAVINWNIDTNDWRGRSADEIANHVISRAADGDVILMHDIYKNTADATRIVLKELTAKGFQFVTVDDLFRLKTGAAPAAGKVYRSAKP